MQAQIEFYPERRTPIEDQVWAVGTSWGLFLLTISIGSIIMRYVSMAAAYIFTFCCLLMSATTYFTVASSTSAIDDNSEPSEEEYQENLSRPMIWGVIFPAFMFQGLRFELVDLFPQYMRNHHPDEFSSDKYQETFAISNLVAAFVTLFITSIIHYFSDKSLKSLLCWNGVCAVGSIVISRLGLTVISGDFMLTMNIMAIQAGLCIAMPNLPLLMRSVASKDLQWYCTSFENIYALLACGWKVAFHVALIHGHDYDEGPEFIVFPCVILIWITYLICSILYCMQCSVVMTE